MHVQPDLLYHPTCVQNICLKVLSLHEPQRFCTPNTVAWLLLQSSSAALVPLNILTPSRFCSCDFAQLLSASSFRLPPSDYRRRALNSTILALKFAAFHCGITVTLGEFPVTSSAHFHRPSVPSYFLSCFEGVACCAFIFTLSLMLTDWLYAEHSFM